MSERRVELAMVAAIFLLTAPVLHDWTAQSASRFSLTAAIVDHHTLEIDDYEPLLGLDQASYEGHIYTDKAPYQPAIAAVPYQLFRLAGGDAFPLVDGERGPDASFHWARWWVTIWSSTIPAMILAILMRRLVKEVLPGVATATAVALTVGTMVLPYAATLFGHVLSTLWVAGAWYLIRPSDPKPARLLAAGAMIGAGIATEYLIAIPAAVLLVVTVLAHRWRGAILLSIGTVVAMIPLFIYNLMVFEDPFTTAYQGHLENFKGSGALGVYNLQPPLLGELTKALIGNRGILVATPVILAALVGAGRSIWDRSSTRRDGVLAFVILGLLLLASTGVDGYGGDVPAPRYLMPVIPFLAIPLADSWRRAPRLCIAATTIGFAIMMLATLTYPFAPTDHPNPESVWFSQLRNGTLVRSIPGMLLGDWALLAVAGVGAWLAVMAVVWDRPGAAVVGSDTDRPVPPATNGPSRSAST